MSARDVALPDAVVAEVRAALAAGASPSAALVAGAAVTPPAAQGQAADRGWPRSGSARGAGGAVPALQQAARTARLGVPLVEIAAGSEGPEAALVRGLAVAEQAGGGALEAVDGVLAAAAEERRTARMLAVATTQARITANVLSALPLVAWLLLGATRPEALAFYRTPFGIGSLVVAGLLLLAARVIIRRLVAGAGEAARRADPLHQPPSRDRRAVAAATIPALLVLGIATSPAVTALALAAAAVLAWRARPTPPDTTDLPTARRPARESAAGSAADPPPGIGAGLAPGGARAGQGARAAAGRPSALRAVAAGLRRAPGSVVRAGATAATVDLVAAGLRCGLTPAGAVALVATIAEPAARPGLEAAARRLRHGWPPADAFAGGPFAGVGDVLAASERWGSPAAPDLARHAAELRDRARAAAAEAAERAQVTLVFPTTLLTVPAFVALVVPPWLWAALRTFGQVGPS